MEKIKTDYKHRTTCRLNSSNSEVSKTNLWVACRCTANNWNISDHSSVHHYTASHGCNLHSFSSHQVAKHPSWCTEQQSHRTTETHFLLPDHAVLQTPTMRCIRLTTEVYNGKLRSLEKDTSITGCWFCAGTQTTRKSHGF